MSAVSMGGQILQRSFQLNEAARFKGFQNSFCSKFWVLAIPVDHDVRIGGRLILHLDTWNIVGFATKRPSIDSLGIPLNADFKRRIYIDFHESWNLAAGAIPIHPSVCRCIEDDRYSMLRQDFADEGHRPIEVLSLLWVIGGMRRELLSQLVGLEHNRLDSTVLELSSEGRGNYRFPRSRQTRNP